MEDIPKDFCYLTHHVDKQKRFECKICGLFLSTKQRILTHLNKKHNKSPLKRVYKQYEDDPSIPVPKRTAMRHSSARQIFSVSSSQCSSAMSDKDHDNTINNENAYEFGNQIEDENFTCNLQDTVFSDSDTQSDLSTESYGIDSSESEIDSSESDLELCDFELSDNDQYENEMSCNDLDRSLYSETEMEALCIASYFLRHNLSGVAIQDLLNLLKVSCTDSNKFREITYDKVLSLAGNANFKTVDYCSVCCQRFPEDPDLFRCETHGCTGLRYKGQLSAQQGASRQPRNSFVIGDLEKQFKLVLERKGSWKSIQDTKMRIYQDSVNTVKTDISDGQFYRTLCRPGQFLNNSNNISTIFNTDGIPLYNSSNVKLWPVFLAINELPPSSRFSRENMILAAIWQGKDKPPFSQYMCAFGEQMCKLYQNGIKVTPFGAKESLDVQVAVFVGTMDLQAKAYVLNMTMHNGAFGCSTCEEPGESVRQGKGYSRYYPYRSPDEKPAIRDADDIKYVKGANATPSVRIKGICGMTGLAAMPWFDVVLGIVPDYMHSVLLGVTKSLMHKFFSPTNSDKPYFIGKHLKKISKRLHGICPPDFIERIPRDLEKNYNHFKATELQTWLLFYALPCLNGYLEVKYLQNLAHLSEGIYLLLGDSISEDDLLKAESLLDSFYEQFSIHYGEGSCGLNVHNIGAHMVFYVRMWGPLWAWSCFAFEDWNAVLLQSVHGTGNVTMQCLRMIEIQLKLNCVNSNSMPSGDARSYMLKMKKCNKSWTVKHVDVDVSTAGALKACTGLSEDEISYILNETGCQNIQSFKKALRVEVNNQKLYSEEYSRMKKRVCNVVLCKNGQLRKISYFLVNSEANIVLAFGTKLEVHCDSFICNSQHIIRVTEATGKDIFSVKDIAEKVFFMHIDGHYYTACMPNSIGHSIFK